MRKYNLFNFLERKIEESEMKTFSTEIIGDIVFKELALHIAITYIANTISKCEFKVFEQGNEVKSQLYYKLNVSPNPNESSSRFINKMIESFYYEGHALIIKDKDNLYCVDGFDLDETNPLKEYIFQNVTVGLNQIRKKYKSSDVFYMKLDNESVKRLIDSIYCEYGEILSQAVDFYKKTNGSKYKLKMDNLPAGTDDDRKKLLGSIRSQLETFMKNSNAVYLEHRGRELEDVTSKASKDTADIISMRKEIFEVVAQAFKIPLSMMYGNITNMDEIVKVYLSICIDPLADMIGEEITRKYYSFEEWKNGCRVKVDTSCVKHVDIIEVGNKIYNAIGSGAINIDDLRGRLGLEKLNTEFSKQFFLSKNFVPAEDMLNGQTAKGGE